MVITLTAEEMRVCMDFAYRCAENQQQIEFGQRDTAERGIPEIGRDNLIGKMAEVAFAKMLRERYNIYIELDFEFYPRGVWDRQDAKINDWRIDVKGTRGGGRWLLVEWSKLNFRQRDNDLSHLYVMASVAWDRETDSPVGTVDLIGCASINRLKPDEELTTIIRKGETLPGTRTAMQADNYGIRFNQLTTDWDFIINKITTEPPPDTDDYPNPYTGQTTAEILREKGRA